ncbi:MAG: VanZ family protein [Lachnospiraceae bacterium]|nr:VanZ family protein [Lachnospiraceae bacterium]
MLKITFFSFFYLAFIIVYEALNVKKQKASHNIEYWIFKVVFYIYVLLVVRITIFPIPFQKLELEGLRRNFGEGLKINLIPLKSIIYTINSNANLLVKFRQIGGNLILLFPLAFYLPLRKEKFQKAKKVFVFLLISSCRI